MPWKPTRHRPRDHKVMFAVNEDGRTAYLTISPRLLRNGDHVARDVIRSRQEKGGIRIR